MYITSDIYLATYLQTMTDENCKLELVGSKKVNFIFDKEGEKFYEDLVERYYDDEDKMLTFSNKFRNTKTKVIHFTKRKR